MMSWSRIYAQQQHIDDLAREAEIERLIRRGEVKRGESFSSLRLLGWALSGLLVLIHGLKGFRLG